MSTLEALLPRAFEPEDEAPMCAEWLSVIETATLLNLHVSTIYRHLHAGTFPCRSMRVGRAWRIRAEDVEGLRTSLANLLRDGDTAANASALLALLGEG